MADKLWTHGKTLLTGTTGEGVVVDLKIHTDGDGKHEAWDEDRNYPNAAAIVTISVWQECKDPQGLAEHLAKEAQKFIDA